MDLTKDGVFQENDSWTLHGRITYFGHSIDFTGEINTKKSETNGWSFTGSSKLNTASLASEVSGTISPMENEAITISKEAFSKMKIKHMVFKNSNFVKDFDKDAFQG